MTRAKFSCSTCTLYLLDILGPEASDFVCIFRMIDSAQAYDEEQVGAAVQESGIPREDIFIVSKVHPRFLGHDETLKSVEETLTKLKVLLQLIFVSYGDH